MTKLLGTQAAQQSRPLHQTHALLQTADAALHPSSACEAAGQSAAEAATPQEGDSPADVATARHASDRWAAHSPQGSRADQQQTGPGRAAPAAAAVTTATPQAHQSPVNQQQAAPARGSAPALGDIVLPGPALAMPASDRLRDRHYLLPAGVRLGLVSDAAVKEAPPEGCPIAGARWLGRTSLAVGCSQTVTPQAAAEAGAAVLDCSLQQSAAWAGLAAHVCEAGGLDAAGRPAHASSSRACTPGEAPCTQQACDCLTAGEQAPCVAACQQCSLR